MSLEDVADIRERLARIEERQLQLHNMITTSLSNYGDLVNRTRKLEDESHFIKSKLWLIAVVAGTIASTAWEFLKAKLTGPNL
jgi:predicted nuclease with TOPRIM domain